MEVPGKFDLLWNKNKIWFHTPLNLKIIYIFQTKYKEIFLQKNDFLCKNTWSRYVHVCNKLVLSCLSKSKGQQNKVSDIYTLVDSL